MSKSNYQIHYAFNAAVKDDLANFLNELIQVGITSFIIDPRKGVFSDSEIIELTTTIKGKADFIVVDDFDFALSSGADGLLISNVNRDISAIKLNHPELKLGGRALSITDCKNWELKGIDYLELAPVKTAPGLKPVLGSEAFSQIIPKEEVYGWMILSLNVPVIASGSLTYQTIEEIVKTADIKGVAISDFFEPQDKRPHSVEKIRGIFDKI